MYYISTVVRGNITIYNQPILENMHIMNYVGIVNDMESDDK